MVEMKVVLKASSEKRKRTQVFPTPESPIRSSLKSRSYVFFAIGRSGSGARRWRPQGIGPSHCGQLLTRVFSGRRTGQAWGKKKKKKRGFEKARATYERPRRGSTDGGAAAFGAPEGGDRGSAASPPAALPGSGESVGTKWPPLPPLRAARPGRSHGRASELGRRGSAERSEDTSRSPPGAETPRAKTRRWQPRRTPSRELSYIATGSRAARPEPPFPRALSRRRARCLTHART